MKITVTTTPVGGRLYRIDFTAVGTLLPDELKEFKGRQVEAGTALGVAARAECYCHANSIEFEAVVAN